MLISMEPHMAMHCAENYDSECKILYLHGNHCVLSSTVRAIYSTLQI